MGYLLLDQYMDMQELRKIHEALHREMQFHFECIIALEKRVSRLDSAETSEEAASVVA